MTYEATDWPSDWKGKTGVAVKCLLADPKRYGNDKVSRILVRFVDFDHKRCTECSLIFPVVPLHIEQELTEILENSFTVVLQSFVKGLELDRIKDEEKQND